MPKENKSNFGTFRNSFEFRIQRKIRDRKTLVHAIHVYAHGVEARQPQEMKFLFRRAGNWIFGFRRRQNLGHAKRKKKGRRRRRREKKKDRIRANISRRNHAPIPSSLDFSLLHCEASPTPPHPSLINLGDKEGLPRRFLGSRAFNGWNRANYRAEVDG